MYEQFFSNLSMHITLNYEEREQITEQLQISNLKKNDVLLHAPDICRNMYFIIKGCLRTYYESDKGAEHIILLSPENWWAGDMSSFSNQSASFYSISALEDTKLVCLPYFVLEALFVQVPKLERFFRIMIQNGFSLYQQRVTQGQFNSAEERYRLFQQLYPGLELRIAQKHIASFLGITPVFLSMIRNRKH